MMIDPEKRVARDHPLRQIKQLTEEALAQPITRYACDTLPSCLASPS